MEGVILFADDHIFDSQRLENKLFRKFNSDGAFSTLPINNLTILEKTVSSISTYKALILDWNFKREIDEDEEGIQMPDENPHEFLKSKKIYSLVYIYSQEEIAQEIKEELETLYPGKIFFEKKENVDEPEKEYEKIINGIKKFEDQNTHLVVPFVWSQAINQSAQIIFSELEQADPNWIKEIYNTAKNDGTEPNTEVIGVFQNLLNESIIQNQPLLKSLDESKELPEVVVADKEDSLAKLYNRIYYTKLIKNAPLMTGDIFKFNEDEFAILITPECDMNKKKDSILEFLIISKKASEAFKKKKKKDDSIFNNGVQSRHILPSFPFESDNFNLSALIDFETAFVVKTKVEFENMREGFKLNSPYIYQVRQRYLSYVGRVGVPAIPQSLRLFNLK
ncbi:hypothetical protein [uncultured Roseivirga sp.]|uniref:hypothetical protein n=1 Tax=uncultured Roseivirga sp. TaxID=543088 RepID=UPI0030DB59DD|tara:strand:+ start:3925 stop:5103 length:1179 start_codon:yes stop_codon:yes gene_type:complete